LAIDDALAPWFGLSVWGDLFLSALIGCGFFVILAESVVAT